LLRSKLKFTKLSPNRTPPLNTAIKLLNKPESQPAIQHTDWQKISSHFRGFCLRRSRGFQQTVTGSGKSLRRQL